MKKYISALIKKLFTREIITYAVSGVLTTLVNYAASYVLFNLLKADENLTTVLAWVVAVLFAFVINDLWVFRVHSDDIILVMKRMCSFFGSRLLTLAIEALGVFIFATKIGIYYWYVKIPVSVLVIILNYLFSKYITFSRRLSEQARNSHTGNT